MVITYKFHLAGFFTVERVETGSRMTKEVHGKRRTKVSIKSTLANILTYFTFIVSQFGQRTRY